MAHVVRRRVGANGEVLARGHRQRQPGETCHAEGHQEAAGDTKRRGPSVTAREAVQVGAKALWLQYNVISPEGVAIAEQGGLKVVVDRCAKVEHARHLGRMHWLGLNTGVVTARRAAIR